MSKQEQTTINNDESNEIFDGSDDKAYFTITPNIVIDSDISAYAKLLYIYLKRVAGETGKCWQSTRTISKNLNISMGTISNSKKELVSAGFIKITKVVCNRGKSADVISVRDIWEENINKYHNRKMVKNDASSTSELISSPHELNSSPGEIKNISLRRSHEELGAEKESALSDPSYEDCTPDGEPIIEKKKKKQKDKRNISPAIISFRRLTGLYPPKINYDQVISVLGDSPDEAKMKRCYQEWCGRGFKPTNLNWLLDWYVNGVPVRGKPMYGKVDKSVEFRADEFLAEQR